MVSLAVVATAGGDAAEQDRDPVVVRTWFADHDFVQRYGATNVKTYGARIDHLDIDPSVQVMQELPAAATFDDVLRAAYVALGEALGEDAQRVMATCPGGRPTGRRSPPSRWAPGAAHGVRPGPARQLTACPPGPPARTVRRRIGPVSAQPSAQPPVASLFPAVRSATEGRDEERT